MNYQYLLIFLIIFVSVNSEFPSFIEAESYLNIINNSNGTRGFKIIGTGQIGFSASFANDVNSDGLNDMLIGSPNTSPNPQTHILYGFNGNIGTSSIQLPQYFNENNKGFSINGSLHTGRDVSNIDDFNNDGIPDLIISDDISNEVYIFYEGIITNEKSLKVPDYLNGTNGFTMHGIISFGSSLSKAGDFNNDGFNDIIIGASSPGGFGYAFIVFGSGINYPKNITIESGSINTLTIRGPFNAVTGYSVSGGSDINNDGIDDVVIGSPGSNNVFVIYGSSIPFPSTFDVPAYLDGNTGFTITGSLTTGISVSSLGDINNDTHNDLIIGCYSSNTVYVLFGGNNSYPSTINLPSYLNGNNGFIITGELGTGYYVNNYPDINGDGINDILISAYLSNRSYVIYGRNTYPLTISLPSYLDGNTGFTIQTNEGRPFIIKGIGDINNDYKSDFLIGIPESNIAYVFFGYSNNSLNQSSSLSQNPISSLSQSQSSISSNNFNTLSYSNFNSLSLNSYNSISSNENSFITQSSISIQSSYNSIQTQNSYNSISIQNSYNSIQTQSFLTLTTINNQNIIGTLQITKSINSQTINKSLTKYYNTKSNEITNQITQSTNKITQSTNQAIQSTNQAIQSTNQNTNIIETKTISIISSNEFSYSMSRIRSNSFISISHSRKYTTIIPLSRSIPSKYSTSKEIVKSSNFIIPNNSNNQNDNDKSNEENINENEKNEESKESIGNKSNKKNNNSKESIIKETNNLLNDALPPSCLENIETCDMETINLIINNNNTLSIFLYDFNNEIFGQLIIPQGTFPNGTELTISTVLFHENENENNENDDLMTRKKWNEDCSNNKKERKQISEGIDIIAEKNGESIQPLKPLTIKFVIPKNKENDKSCLSSSPTNENNWDCENTEFKENDNNIIASSNVNHLTSFAVLIQNNSFDNNDCSNDYWWIICLISILIALIISVTIILILVYVKHPKLQTFIFGDSYIDREFTKKMNSVTSNSRISNRT